MFSFNTLLRGTGVDPANVKLVRHQVAGAKRGCTPYDLWYAQDGRLEFYQSIQSKPRFAGSTHVASFIGMPANDTLFVGLYGVQGVSTAPPGTLDPVTGKDCSGMHLYDLVKSELLSAYDGRLYIDWGKSYISWSQNAKGQDKPIVEVRREIGEPPFPGFMGFQTVLGALTSVPLSWRAALRASNGVYLLVCQKSGKQYVGSAYGTGGFWERWENYARNGHGGNEGMKLDPHTEYQVSILEVASSSAQIADIVALESRWKGKLGSRGEFGLNRN